MATLSSAGIGSGLDVASIVSQMMVIERQPIKLLESKTAGYNQKLSSLGTIKGALSSLQTAAEAFTKGLSMKATSGDSTLFTASATSAALPGNYAVEVQHLADYNKVVSKTAYSTSDTLASGNLEINLGTFNDNGIAASSRDGTNWSYSEESSVTVNFTGGTLAQLRDAINTQAGDKVQAQIVNAADGSHLVISSKEKGRSNSLQMTGSGSLSGFSYDIRAGSNASMTESTISWSTELLVDGLAVRSNSNVVTGAISGITLNVLKTSASAGQSTSLDVKQDTESITSQVQAFVKAYNTFNSSVKVATTYDASSKTASPLTGDSAVRMSQSQIRTAATSVPSELSSASLKYLSDIGISIDRNGEMQLDSSKLTSALEKSQSDVSSLLTAYGKQMDKAIDAQLDSTNGILTTRTKGINDLIKYNATRIEALETRMTGIEARYNRQFSALDTIMANMQKTSSYLTQQLASLS